jgi:hypothetical protein
MDNVKPTEAKPAVETPVHPSLKSDAFKGNNMLKWAEQSGVLDKGPEPVAAPVPEKKAEAPCPGCDKDKADKAAAAKPAPGQPAAVVIDKPFKVLEVEGKKFVFNTKEEYDAALSWNRDQSERETKFAAITAPLQKLVTLIEQGKLPDVVAAAKPAPVEKEEELDMEDVHPAIRKRLEDQEKEIAGLRTFTKKIELREGEERFTQAKSIVENLATEARTKHPFDDFEDPDSKDNVSMDLYAGYVSVLVNRDALKHEVDPSHPVKTMPEYLDEAAKRLSKYQGFHRGSSGNGGAIDAEALRKSHPDVVKAIEQSAVANYLRGQEGLPPTIQASGSEARQTDTPGSKKALKSFNAYMKAAEEDPEISEEISKVGRRARASA